MADYEQWKQFIRRGNHNRVNRMMRSLFSDMSRTLPFLLAVLEVNATNRELPGLAERIREIRRLARALPLSQLERVLDAVRAQGERCGDCYVLILGAYRDEADEAMATFQRIVDVANLQLNTISKSAQPSSASYALLALMEAGAKGNTSAWTNFLRRSHELSSTALLEELLTVFMHGEFTYRIVPYGIWKREDGVASWGEGKTFLFSIPAPDELVRWMGAVVVSSLHQRIVKDMPLSQLVETMRTNAESWRSAYEDMWLEMMLEPVWGLRDAGLDCVTVSVPAIRTAGHRYMRFYPRDPFPNMRVVFCMTRADGKDRFIEMDLEPSDLLQVRQSELHDGDSALYWVDRALAFTAVRAAWTITMGHLSSETSETGGPHPSGGAIVRPRFRRLPTGHQSSPEARARALDTFRREPLAGFTFVRQYERGDFPQSGDPLFSLSELGVK